MSENGQFLPPEVIFQLVAEDRFPMAEVVYRDEQVTIFKDIRPQARIHLLIIPNQLRLNSLFDVDEETSALLGRAVQAAARVAGESEPGTQFRLVNNCQHDGGQEVYYLHLHLLGGEELGPLVPGGLPPIHESFESDIIVDPSNLTHEEIENIGKQFLKAVQTAEAHHLESGFRLIIEPQGNKEGLEAEKYTFHVFGGRRLSSQMLEKK